MKWAKVADHAVEGLIWLSVLFILSGGVKYVCGPACNADNIRSIIDGAKE